MSIAFWSITDRAAKALLELGDPLLEQGLLVLRVVVLGVLGDVTELARLLDALGDLAPAHGRKLGDIGLELFEAFLCDWYLASHDESESLLDAKDARFAKL